MPFASHPLPAVTTAISATTVTTPHPVTAATTTPASQASPSSIEAKIVILGAQGVGKTSLVNRFINPNADLPTASQATIGASFVTKRIHDPDSNTTVRLQIWDTAGQERFRSISRLYYRGANAGLLCYDVTDEKSWEEMKGWLEEMRENCDLTLSSAAAQSGVGMVVHVVGTKIDLAANDPTCRQVPFEKTISYVAEHLGGINIGGAVNSADATSIATSRAATPPPLHQVRPGSSPRVVNHTAVDSKRSSAFWMQDVGWDSCHEISAKDNDGIEEMFRVIARKLVEQRNKREAWEAAQQSQTPGWSSVDGNASTSDYFGSRRDRSGYAAGRDHNTATGSFRLGMGDKRKSWLGLPAVMGHSSTSNVTDGTGAAAGGAGDGQDADGGEGRRRGQCC